MNEETQTTTESTDTAKGPETVVYASHSGDVVDSEAETQVSETISEERAISLADIYERKSRRQHFAMIAMDGILAGGHYAPNDPAIAGFAIFQADRLIELLDKE